MSDPDLVDVHFDCPVGWTNVDGVRYCDHCGMAEGVLRYAQPPTSRKIHGDFGDMTRYDVVISNDLADWPAIELDCQDCACMIAAWPQQVNLAEINKAAAEHEISEESDETT